VGGDGSNYNENIEDFENEEEDIDYYEDGSESEGARDADLRRRGLGNANASFRKVPRFIVESDASLEELRLAQRTEMRCMQNALMARTSAEGQLRATDGGAMEQRKNRSQRRDTSSRRDSEAERERLLSREELWHRVISLCPYSFFEGRAARMLDQVSCDRGSALYQAVPVNEKNNSDVSFCYEIEYAAKTVLEAAPASGMFAQFRSAVGQLLRLAIAWKKVDRMNAWKPGAVFMLMCDRQLLEVFFAHFCMCASASTVVNKIQLLKKIGYIADIYFTREQETHILGHLRVAMAWLEQTARVQKRESRWISAHNLTYEKRAMAGRMLHENDFSSIFKKCQANLSGIIRTAREVEGKNGQDGVRAMLTQQIKILQKYCINFTVMLLIAGGGHRPQVYTTLVCPTDGEMHRWEDIGRVELRPRREKRLRDAPYIVMNLSCAPLIRFYVKSVRPAIHSGRPELETEPSLLVNTRTCSPVSTGSLRATLKTWLSFHDPELKSITTMDLRGSFATMMFGKYRRGMSFKGKTVDEFLNELATMMNTSAEMLRKTYIAWDGTEYDETARELARALDLEDERMTSQ
jgi:hypothetical protein